MVPKITGCALLGLAAVLMFGTLAPQAFVAPAEAGANLSKRKLYERRVLRHKEYRLKRAEHHNMRQVAREKRHIEYIKRELHHPKKV